MDRDVDPTYLGMERMAATHLEMALGIEKQILRLDVAVGNALAVKVGHAVENLLEAALDLARAHATKKENETSGQHTIFP
jgi:hypothetical protein